MIIISLLCLNIFNIVTSEKYLRTENTFASNTLEFSSGRGTIYDHSMKKLVNTEKKIIAAVNPTNEALNALSEILTKERFDLASALWRQGKPFLFDINTDKIDCDDIVVINTFERYSAFQLAPHIVGYPDSEGNGAYAIEKAYDDLLKSQSPQRLSYAVDAIGRPLSGIKPNISTFASQSGVVLTIDSDIQKSVQTILNQRIKTGACVVVDLADGGMRAVASVPDFSPVFLGDAMDNEDSPFINRAFTSYNVGSVFKLVSVASALENDISPSYGHNCTGSITVSGQMFRCNKMAGHGFTDMKSALAQSCNSYFIDMILHLGGSPLLDTAGSLGFGKGSVFAPGYFSSAGNLPDRSAFINPAAIGNFAFGQGELMATPVQFANLIYTICSDGEYRQLSLVEKTIDKDGRESVIEESKKTRVMSAETAESLREYMKEVVDSGTGKSAKPSDSTAAGKTATAQTGVFKDGREVIQSWFAGFFPYEQPKYAIVVVVEDLDNGAIPAAPIFKEIADKMLTIK